MKINLTVFLLIGLFVFSFAFSLPVITGHSDETFIEAEHLIKEQISCDELTDEQIELIGDYIMEKMHPGEIHEIMDERMGGEGSESLRLAHINMAERFYCNEYPTNTNNNYGMMPGMMSGMMYNQDYKTQYNFMWIFNLLLILVIVLAVILLVRQIKK